MQVPKAAESRWAPVGIRGKGRATKRGRASEQDEAGRLQGCEDEFKSRSQQGIRQGRRGGILSGLA